ncbi:hypothetical protein CMV30_08935 [Nibricoccus aquaticus]|uniref:Flagellar protein FlgN n=1 Tax=Nibricoccus aquaticus TaxID=2576891 RepID=A0A290QCU1_9BACT|nr:hypothetical protein [Nibricoccus aquaticus]ATC64066.1 hypothetical protein CMV30_08935 [Nibricoccus aquaticus]
MTPTEALRHHQNLCDELHQLALEENRFLKQNQRVPDAPLLEKKRALLARLDESLSAIKAGNAAASSGSPARPDPDRSEIIEKSRAKLLQILHLDRENEQLLLRYSLGARPARPVQNASAPVSPAATAPGHLQRLYDRHR